jgi:hypothetical protein
MSQLHCRCSSLVVETIVVLEPLVSFIIVALLLLLLFVLALACEPHPLPSLLLAYGVYIVLKSIVVLFLVTICIWQVLN